jgi:plastocyanin
LLQYSRICLLVVSLALLGIGVPRAALAHGPTIEISHDELKPSLLNLFVGTTVHFSNTVEMPGGHVIVDESGTIESPALEKPGDGWHYTFEKEGTFEIHIKQHPTAKARIVVVPKR